MSSPQPPTPAQPLVSIFARQDDLIQEAKAHLEAVLGPVTRESPLLPFDKTDYYENEFGKPLVRRFFFFEKLISPEKAVALKWLAWKVERRLSVEGRRLVNIDPGYLVLERLVLTTFKNFSHRLYLGKGVYGEVTLLFSRGRFEPLPWTYPDYASPEVLEILQKAREDYKQRIRGAL